jgi:hypothetical protein
MKYGGGRSAVICPDEVMLRSRRQPEANICSATSTA